MQLAVNLLAWQKSRLCAKVSARSHRGRGRTCITCATLMLLSPFCWSSLQGTICRTMSDIHSVLACVPRNTTTRLRSPPLSFSRHCHIPCLKQHPCASSHVRASKMLRPGAPAQACSPGKTMRWQHGHCTVAEQGPKPAAASCRVRSKAV